jgi:hypothetical protein
MNEVTRGLRSAFRRVFSSFLALNLSGCCMLASTTFSDSISMRLAVADLAESTFYAGDQGLSTLSKLDRFQPLWLFLHRFT